MATRFELIMVAKADLTGRSLRPNRVWCALAAAITAGMTLVAGEIEAVAQERANGVVELVDLDNGALDDPDLIRLRTALPRDWPGPRGRPPYNQVPPRAQRDFAPPSPSPP